MARVAILGRPESVRVGWNECQNQIQHLRKPFSTYFDHSPNDYTRVGRVPKFDVFDQLSTPRPASIETFGTSDPQNALFH